jgi:hypothetical protein
MNYGEQKTQKTIYFWERIYTLPLGFLSDNGGKEPMLASF